MKWIKKPDQLHVRVYMTNNSYSMEYSSTPYVGLTPKKHGHHTLTQIYNFAPKLTKQMHFDAILVYVDTLATRYSS